MAEWERYEQRLTVVRVTYVIRGGARWDIAQRALHQAQAEWRELVGVEVDADVPPTAVTLRGLGQDVCVRIEAEVEESDTEPEPGDDLPEEPQRPVLSADEEERDG